jgi:hypothetical protein
MQSFETYHQAFWTTLMRRHHAEFCWRRLRRLCACGRDLPCPIKQDATAALRRVWS